MIPVEHRGKAVATLNLASHCHDAFRPSTREAAEAIAAQIGGVISRIRAESGLREGEENLRRLSEEDATSRLAGCDLAGFIQKPYRHAALLKKIHDILRR